MAAPTSAAATIASSRRAAAAQRSRRRRRRRHPRRAHLADTSVEPTIAAATLGVDFRSNPAILCTPAALGVAGVVESGDPSWSGALGSYTVDVSVDGGRSFSDGTAMVVLYDRSAPPDVSGVAPPVLPLGSGEATLVVSGANFAPPPAALRCRFAQRVARRSPSSSKPRCCRRRSRRAAPPRATRCGSKRASSASRCTPTGRTRVGLRRRRRRFGDVGRLRCDGGARARGRHAGGGWPHRARRSRCAAFNCAASLASRAKSATRARPPPSSTPRALRASRRRAAWRGASGSPSRRTAPRRRATGSASRTTTSRIRRGRSPRSRRAARSTASAPSRCRAPTSRRRARSLASGSRCPRGRAAGAGERRRRRHLCRRLARPLPRPGVAHTRRRRCSL